MSAYIFNIKQNDRRPSMVVHLKNYDGTELDLSSANGITFTMTKEGEQTPTINKASITIVDATKGQVKYDWSSGQTSEVGTYKGELEVTWTSGVTQTFPADDYIKVIINKEL